jgi:hypothetical protein
MSIVYRYVVLVESLQCIVSSGEVYCSVHFRTVMFNILITPVKAITRLVCCNYIPLY